MFGFFVSANYVKCQVPINSANWTPVIAPMDCNYFGVKNSDGSAVTLRTDMNDATTEDTLAGGVQEGVTAEFRPHLMPTRFQQGDTVLWVKATQGVGPLMVTWVL